jgi:hypothetical protein
MQHMTRTFKAVPEAQTKALSLLLAAPVPGTTPGAKPDVIGQCDSELSRTEESRSYSPDPVTILESPGPFSEREGADLVGVGRCPNAA